MSDMVMLEPSTVQETCGMARYAFDLSEESQMPVFVRSVTCVAQSCAAARIHEPVLPNARAPAVKRDVGKYAKAGAAICMAQHADAIRALGQGRGLIREKGLRKLALGPTGGAGFIASGAAVSYLSEALRLAGENGCDVSPGSHPAAACTALCPVEEIRELIRNCGATAAAEEPEPHSAKCTCGPKCWGLISVSSKSRIIPSAGQAPSRRP